MDSSTTLTSYYDMLSLHGQPGPAGARYYEFLLEALYNAAQNEEAMVAFRSSLSPAEQKDLEWWMDEVLRRFTHYQQVARSTMEQAQALRQEEGGQEAARTLMAAAAPRIKRLWQGVSPELSVAYAFHGRPYGNEAADLQRWANEVAPLRGALRAEEWHTFVQGLATTPPAEGADDSEQSEPPAEPPAPIEPPAEPPAPTEPPAEPPPQPSRRRAARPDRAALGNWPRRGCC